MYIIRETIWYGSWILIGIVFGLLLYPNISHAEEILTDNFDSYTVGDVVGQGGWTQYQTAQAGNVNTTQYYSSPNSLVYNRSIESANITDQYWATTTADTSEISYRLLSTVTNVGDGAGVMFSFSNNPLSINSAFYICSYGTTTSAFTMRVSTNSSRCTTNYTATTQSWAENTWIEVRVNIDLNAYTAQVYFDDVLATTTAINTGVQFFRDLRIYQSQSYVIDYFDDFGFYSTGSGSSASSTEYITSVYPTTESYSVATTSYVNFNVQIPSARYEQNAWKAKIACAEFREQTYFEGFLDYGFSYTVDLDDGDCSGGNECTPHGVSYPEDGELEADSVYNCTASLLEARWYWFDKVIETERFRFYTFASTSTDQFASLIARANEYSGTLNTSGTSTSPLFGDCSILNGQISDCVIEPVKFLIIPSQTDRDNIKSLIDSSVFGNFPFSYIGMFNEDMASTSYFATTTAEFPDFTFDTQNMNGVTTTITIFDGSQFVSAWSSVEEFDTLRTAIQYALVIMFTTILYFRVRRLIPSGDNVKGV